MFPSHDRLANDKAAMQKIDITQDKFASLLGIFYVRGWMTVDMVSAATKEYFKPTYKYSTPKDNLWTCYNHILVALRQSNPRVWLANQSAIHLYMCLEFDLAQFDVDETADEDVCQETGTTQEEDYDMFVLQFFHEGEDGELDTERCLLINKDDYHNGDKNYPNFSHYADGIVFGEEMSILINDSVNLLGLDDQVELFLPQVPAIDTPEITGIPNGNTMSDTDDEEYTEDELASLLYGVDNNNEVVHDLDAS